MDSTPIVLLPAEIKISIMSHLDKLATLSRLGQTCRTWYEVANEELYKRDARENSSFAIKWMTAHAVNKQTTEAALRTLDISRRWGCQVNAIQPYNPREQEERMTYESSTAFNMAVALGNVSLAVKLLEMGAHHDIPCSTVDWILAQPRTLWRIGYFQRVLAPFKVIWLGKNFPLYMAFMKGDVHMCQLLLERGFDRVAMIVGSKHSDRLFRISILHIVAADPITDYGQWRFFYDRFREHINEPCMEMNLTPLHVAMMSGCGQGVHNALETGADKEARNSDMQTPKMMKNRRFADSW